MLENLAVMQGRYVTPTHIPNGIATYSDAITNIYDRYTNAFHVYMYAYASYVLDTHMRGEHNMAVLPDECKWLHENILIIFYFCSKYPTHD
jgi:hypothetical protein